MMQHDVPNNQHCDGGTVPGKTAELARLMYTVMAMTQITETKA